MATDPASIERLEEYLQQFNRLNAVQQEAWLELDLTMSQDKALVLLRTRQPLSVSQVGSVLGMRLGTASALVNRLGRLGLVSRGENPKDRRQTLVELTPAAETMLARIEAQTIARMRKIFRRMSQRGRDAWAVALEEAVRTLASEEP